ncbi:PilT protein domain protein [Desulfamplus magnetovallimortis]|uniref:PilT protein domain protein n=1 Tax=Desulfamplus magnetovallimortis TaxID=1246637 RepID=A0A1W1H5F7_9BACT|nr:type II toxin-antitoxin system VapC family toxin [Desulfamplus magnetovallimortis]SLM27721.1 PilT protein domain protein [Desulfamplus magnetovallimortis]
MNYLIDTHYLLWSMFEPSRISINVLDVFNTTDKVKYVSKISYWEISLKYSLGKLELYGVTPEDLLEITKDAGFKVYDIHEQDVISSYQLPSVPSHKDPFDRMLIWQCIKNNLVLITNDKKIQAYREYGLKLL